MGKKSILHRVWNDAPTIESQEDLFQLFLEKKNLDTPEKIQNFLSPQLSELHSPWLFSGMKTCIERLKKAMETHERIIVFGDFDADGITSTIILVSTLQVLGASVSYRIPNRDKDSHGLKKYIIDEIAEKKVSVVLTCDCGINDIEEMHYAQDLGIDLIISDHHTPDTNIKKRPVVAAINPLLESCSYPDKNLSGSAIAYKIAQALLEQSNIEEKEKLLQEQKIIEMATIGIVADCVPLKGENRILVKHGLEYIKQTQWPPLQHMLDVAGVHTETINEETIGFTIAPRLNASSRMGDVLLATQLFLGDSNHTPARIQTLEQLNNQRKDRTQEIFDQSLSQIRPHAPFQILKDPSWEPGILGLVAARHCEKLNVPVLVCQEKTDGTLAASCRAPQGYSIIEALHRHADLFGVFGGHEGAAGFKTDQKNFAPIQKKLDAFFESQKTINPSLEHDAYISPELLDLELFDFLKAFAPFGVGHEKPIFGLKNILLEDILPVGKMKNHFRITGLSDKKRFSFMAFFADSWIEKINPQETVDILFTLSESFWNDERRLDFHIADIRMSQKS